MSAIDCSLPDRQLRKSSLYLPVILRSSLPDRQLRNGVNASGNQNTSSLPDRQLRKNDLYLIFLHNR